MYGQSRADQRGIEGEESMAIIGFLLMFAGGLFVLIAGLLAAWAGLLFGGAKAAYPALILPAIGAAILYFAGRYAPFTVQFSQ